MPQQKQAPVKTKNEIDIVYLCAISTKNLTKGDWDCILSVRATNLYDIFELILLSNAKSTKCQSQLYLRVSRSGSKKHVAKSFKK